MSTLKAKDNSVLFQRLTLIQQAEKLTDTQFAAVLGASYHTIINARRRGTEPSANLLKNTAERWPEYAYWLLTGKTDSEHGHHSPETKHGA